MASDSTLAVFITATTLFPEELDHIFFLIQADSAQTDPEDRRWLLLPSKNLPSTPPGATQPPLPALSSGKNAFAGMSLAEINVFVRRHEDAFDALTISARNWLIVDQTCLGTATCLVCEQYYDIGNDEGVEGRGLIDEFRACRVPYEKAWSMIINLDIGNMHFVEWIDEAAGVQEDGSWKWLPF
ncbi:hypothetical protein B0H17DRAFT_1334587 [Mycena rosella]|uniref:DUF6924 domain-containing protein n=1 Tax=Mycena rosella TaxID=1033263 RepID=A0AAD7GAG1_MYCRO|nr:hypothetical protein B0H17DRAFT_1334587 [Mycena rosella]